MSHETNQSKIVVSHDSYFFFFRRRMASCLHRGSKVEWIVPDFQRQKSNKRIFNTGLVLWELNGNSHGAENKKVVLYRWNSSITVCALFNRLKNWMNQQILSEEKEEAYRDSKTNRFNFKMCEFDQENNCGAWYLCMLVIYFVWLWN